MNDCVPDLSLLSTADLMRMHRATQSATEKREIALELNRRLLEPDHFKASGFRCCRRYDHTLFLL